ncbi:MAG: ABC transporter ATP-binding protein [Calditrichaeota bacterium]|nr:ABC transporter ATP-binding protein [Calditrichota bacterium]MCB0266589.1 ABC transporter ATP-binding protein [Calditrichota bacterium]
MSNAQSLIQINNLSKSFREGEQTRKVLQSLDLRIHRGEIIVLLGRSGSGKSTLLNLLSGIDLPDSGEIIIDGINLTRQNEQERTLFRRRNIGFVFQFFNLIPTLTVAENLLLPLELNDRADETGKNRVQQLLEDVGLGDRANSFPDRLSGGEQQRVAIARALVHDPLLLLADEPTGNLDFETGKKIIDLLDKLVRQRGKNMVMATHSRDVIGLADRVFAVRNGQLIEQNEQKVLNINTN